MGLDLRVTMICFQEKKKNTLNQNAIFMRSFKKTLRRQAAEMILSSGEEAAEGSRHTRAAHRPGGPSRDGRQCPEGLSGYEHGASREDTEGEPRLLAIAPGCILQLDFLLPYVTPWGTFSKTPSKIYSSTLK